MGGFPAFRIRKQWDYGKRSGDGVLFYMDGEFCLKTSTKRWQSHSIPCKDTSSADEAEGGRTWTSAVGTARILTKNICSAGDTDSMSQRSERKRAKHRSEILPNIGFHLISVWIYAKMGLGEAK
jgi:hypothetical protein